MENIRNFFGSFKITPLKSILTLICCSLFFLELLFVFVFTMMENLNILPIIITCVFFVATFVYSYLYMQVKINICIFSLVMFLLYALLVSLLGQSRIIPYYRTLLRMFLMFYVTFLFCINFYNLKLLLLAFVITGILFCLIFSFAYIDQIFNFSTFSDGRLGNLFGSVNYAGSTIGFTLMICSIFVSLYRKYVIPYYILSIILIFLIFKTGCRSAFVVSLLSIFVCSINLFWKKNKFLFLIIVLSAIALITIILFLPSSAYFRERFFAMFNLLGDGNKQDMSFNERLMMQINAYQFWVKNLFFGYGTDSFAVISSFGTYSHAGLSELLVNYGLIGTTLFLFPYAYFFRKKFKGTHAYLFFLMVFICYIIPEMFDGVFFYEKKYWLLIALCFANYSILEQQTEINIGLKKKEHSILPLFFINLEKKYEKRA